MYPELKDKVVILTGASGGLGTAVTHFFYEAGARLVLVDYPTGVLQEKFGGLNESQILMLDQINVTERADVEWVAQKAVERFGGVDVLVNIVGGFRAGDPVHETGEEVWELMMEMNAKSVFLVSGIIGRIMVGAGKGGRIINIGAKGGLTGGKNSAAYSASKAAVLRITESMSAELKDANITVNAIIPSTIDTAANRRDMPNADFSKWVTPESLAGVIAFLASDGARDVTGALLPVYGRS